MLIKVPDIEEEKTLFRQCYLAIPQEAEDYKEKETKEEKERSKLISSLDFKTFKKEFLDKSDLDFPQKSKKLEKFAKNLQKEISNLKQKTPLFHSFHFQNDQTDYQIFLEKYFQILSEKSFLPLHSKNCFCLIEKFQQKRNSSSPSSFSSPSIIPSYPSFLPRLNFDSSHKKYALFAFSLFVGFHFGERLAQNYFN